MCILTAKPPGHTRAEKLYITTELYYKRKAYPFRDQSVIIAREGGQVSTGVCYGLAATKLSISLLNIPGLGFRPKLSILGLAPEAGSL